MTAANSMHIQAAHHRRHANAGFSLIEMAVVLMIMTLVLGGLMMPLSAQIELRRRTETQRALEDAREALIGYAIANGVLPCPSAPDSNNRPTGVARTTCDTTNNSGYLPWATLGVTKQDAWGNLFRYTVSLEFTNPITLNSARTITVQSRDSNGGEVPLSNNIPAVVLSHGKNGYGAINGDGIPQYKPTGFVSSNPDEDTNAVSNIKFFSRTPAPAGYAAARGGEFDDMIAWLSPNILFNRMAAAGSLAPGSTATLTGTVKDTAGSVSTLDGTITWP